MGGEGMGREGEGRVGRERRKGKGKNKNPPSDRSGYRPASPAAKTWKSWGIWKSRWKMCFCQRCVTVWWTQSRMQQSVNTCSVKLLLKTGSQNKRWPPMNAGDSVVCVLINAGSLTDAQTVRTRRPGLKPMHMVHTKPRRVLNNRRSSIDAGSLTDAQTVRTRRPVGLKPMHTVHTKPRRVLNNRRSSIRITF